MNFSFNLSSFFGRGEDSRKVNLRFGEGIESVKHLSIYVYLVDILLEENGYYDLPY